MAARSASPATTWRATRTWSASPSGSPALAFSDAAELDRAAATLGAGTRDTENLTLQVPSDGGMRSLRWMLDRLDRALAEPVSLTVHTPDLDDVFLALTDATKGDQR